MNSDLFATSGTGSSLYDTPNRELASNASRWLSPDPAGASWNPYAYPTNPNTATDPSGAMQEYHTDCCASSAGLEIDDFSSGSTANLLEYGPGEANPQSNDQMASSTAPTENGPAEQQGQSASAQNKDTVTVEYVQGHGGNPAGHAVISVDGKTPVGLDQKKASAAAALEDKTTPGAVVPVDPSRKVKDQATIQVTPDQAAKIQTFLDKASTNPPNYNLYHSNCAQFCERALQAGGVKDVPNDVTPKGLVNDLNHAPSFVDYLRAVPFPPPFF